jgi:hypothetical protein
MPPPAISTAAEETAPDRTGFLAALVGDGRPLLTLTALALLLSGAFALFLTATRQFLPHDLEFLRISAADLCAVAECRVSAFMFHDRAAFGGSLIAVGTLYLWLAHFPMARGEPWAWWTFAITGGVGFLSFLAYLGYGYLDSWHGIATLALVPCLAGGLLMTRRPAEGLGWSEIFRPGARPTLRSRFGVGRAFLLATAAGMMAGGGTIVVLGMTTVFVPEDIAFMGVTAEQLHAISPRLVPLIAHDRAGFGGGILTAGLAVGLCVWCGEPTRSLWDALLLAGVMGFGCAIGVHVVVGYTTFTHLAPAIAGAVWFLIGMALTAPAMLGSKGASLKQQG